MRLSSTRRHHAIAIISACLMVLTGCTTLTIDEAFVFRPQFGQTPTTTDNLQLRWQDVFDGTGAFSVRLNANGERAHYRFAKGEIAPASVTHGIRTGDGQSIAWSLISRPEPDRPLFVHCGGSTATRYYSGTLYALKLIALGDVLLFDYPGYGDSDGEISPDSLIATNQLIGDLANELARDGRPVILWGHSLGGFICANMIPALASVDAIVLEASARNAESVAKASIPVITRPFVRAEISPSLQDYDNVAMLEGFDGPILILGGRRDRTLPVQLSRELVAGLKASGNTVNYVEFRRANHISIPTDPDFADTIQKALQAFAPDPDLTQAAD